MTLIEMKAKNRLELIITGSDFWQDIDSLDIEINH